MNAVAADGSPVNPWLVAVVVSLATFMEVLDTTITNVSLTHIAGELSATQDESTWILTSYLVANGIVLPLSGWLAGVFGRKRFFMMCIAAFTLASLACGAATSLGELIFFRLIQGLAGGGLQPMQQSIILDAFPPEKRGAVFGITGITMIAAPVLGPLLGGLITDNYSWRWIFFINIPVGLFAFVMVGRLVSDPLHAIAKGLQKIDGVGLGLIVLGLGALQIVMDKGQQDDWFDSNFICMMAAISVAAITGAFIWLLHQEDPIVDVRLLKDRAFGLGMLLIFFTGFALYGSSALLPLLVQSQFGYDATTAGLVFTPGALALIVLMPISGKLVARVQARYLIAFGLILLTIGMGYTANITPQTDYNTFVFMRFLQVLGLPFLFIPTSTLAFSNIARERSSKASALFALGRNLGGSIGIAIATSYLARRQQVEQVNLSSHLAAGNAVYENHLSHLTHAFIAHGVSAADAAHSAIASIYRELLEQSTILAYADTFQFMAIMLAGAACLTLLVPANKMPTPGAKQTAPAAAEMH